MVAKSAGSVSVLAAIGFGVQKVLYHLSEPVLEYAGALIETAAGRLRLGSAFVKGSIQISVIVIALVVKVLLWCFYWIPEPKAAAWVSKSNSTVTERAVGPLTCSSKSKNMDAGTFVLIERGAEWDEVLLVKKVSPLEWLAYTTVPSGSRTMWSLVELVIGKFRAVNGWDSARSKPPDLDERSINWVCHPSNLADKWDCSEETYNQLVMEADMIAELVRVTPAEVHRHKAGANEDIKELVPANLGPAPIQGAVIPAAGGANLAPSSSGLAGGAQPGPSQKELESLVKMVEELKLEVAADSSKKDKKKKSKKKKSKRKKNRSRSRSSASSSSSRSGSSSGASSDYCRWREKAKSKEIKAKALYAIDSVKFKRRADLLAFASKHEGALTAAFVNSIRQKLLKAPVRQSKELRDTTLCEFVASGSSGLSDIRDQREMATLLTVMDLCNKRELEKMMDVISMRCMSILAAKAKGGTWEAASKMELIAEQNGKIGPAGLSSMT